MRRAHVLSGEVRRAEQRPGGRQDEVAGGATQQQVKRVLVVENQKNKLVSSLKTVGLKHYWFLLFSF